MPEVTESQKEKRRRIVRFVLWTVAAAIWALGVTLAVEKGWAYWIPDWVVVAMLVVPILFCLYLGVTHDVVKKYHRRIADKNPLVSFAIFVLIGAAIGAVVWVLIEIPDWRPSAPSTTAALPASPPPISLPASSPYIKGTTVTHATLERAFPFGYVVFSPVSEPPYTRWAYEPSPQAGKMRWQIDHDTVRITPDFAKRRMRWDISIIKANVVTPEGSSRLENVEIVDLDVPLVLNKLCSAGVFSFKENQPEPFVATLSDDQRFPVFALGFRIPPAETPPPSSTPLQ